MFKPMEHAAETSKMPESRRAERRIASVLFTDMVGYTATVEGLGAEKAVHFTRALHELLTKVVEENGGTVRGFAGDSIMAIFGIPEALEDAGLRACVTAMAIHQAFEDAGEAFDKKFGKRPVMRVGVCSGSVIMATVEGEGADVTAVGNTVNRASRIQALAPEGGCLICDDTRRMVEWLVDLSFGGEHTMKGVSKRQKLWQLQAVHDGATRFDASLGRGLSAYVGRDKELSVLSEALGQTPNGVCVADLVAEPGLGKTRLVFEFLARAKASNVPIFTGQCNAVGQRVPFLPFLEVVRGAFQLYDEDNPTEIAIKLRRGLKRTDLLTDENLGLLKNLLGLALQDGELDGLDGVLIGLRTRDLLPALLQAQCDAGPVILLVEDMHWVDSASEDLIRRIIREGQTNLLILYTRRPEYVPDWLDHPALKQITLKPLEAEDIRTLVQTRLGVASLPDTLVSQVVERAGGNPLFAEEVLSFLVEQGALKVADGSVSFDVEQGETALPAGMQSLLSARIQQLQPDDRAFLQAAATIGRRFDPGLLSLVVERPEETGVSLRRLEALDLVHREASSSDYMFRHVLLRDTVYQSLLSDHRSDLHFAIAQALETRNANRLPEAAETLAYHYAQTDRSDLAFHYSALAGVKSLGVFSDDQANQYFAAALAIYEQDPSCATDDVFAEFLGNFALCTNISLDVMTMIKLAPRMQPILARIGDNPNHILFLHHYVSCLVCNTQFIEALRVQKELTAMAERLGDPKSISYAMVNELSVSIYSAPISNEEFQEKREIIEDALSNFDDAYLQNFYLATVGWNELTRGRVANARATAEQMVAEGTRRKDPRALGYGTAMKALVAVLTDDHQAALDLSTEALELSRAEFEIAIAESSRVSALVALERPGARDTLQTYVDLREADGCTLFAGVPQGMLGVGLALEGKVSEGLHHIESVIEIREKEGALIAADWNRLLLSEIYLQILSGEGDASIGVLLRNFRSLLGVMLSGEKRIKALIGKARENTQFDTDGHYFGRGEMILGLMHKHKKRNAQAIEHLKTAQRVIAPSGKTPMLARIEDALEELTA
ncbi:ATP-binding protein [Shimia sp. SK013]|uniref:ATP-binding protein n=1 Tax=Shimia sp. SK013 TaxID=1389006 RepID=UPI0009E663F4|nr:adenylate/guanylate cyclase domain-containing protein [Shimia sp. SK013]